MLTLLVKYLPAGNATSDISNGEADPEWGFDVIIYGGFLRYGLWADHQR